MRKAVFIFTLVIVSVCQMLAQDYQDFLKETVYLKNGSMIRGVIIEQVPNELLKIQTADGSIFVFKMSEVEKITKEIVGGQMKLHRASQEDMYYSFPERGYSGFVDFGYTIGLGKFSEYGRVDFSTSHGYQFNPHFFLGGGMGYQYCDEADLSVIPVFADFRVNLLKGKVIPFVAGKIGYSLGTDYEELKGLGFYFAPNAGVRFALPNKLAVNLTIGYTMQYINVYYPEISIPGMGGYLDDMTYYDNFSNWGGLSIKAGLEF